MKHLIILFSLTPLIASAQTRSAMPSRLISKASDKYVVAESNDPDLKVDAEFLRKSFNIYTCGDWDYASRIITKNIPETNVTIVGKMTVTNVVIANTITYPEGLYKGEVLVYSLANQEGRIVTLTNDNHTVKLVRADIPRDATESQRTSLNRVPVRDQALTNGISQSTLKKSRREPAEPKPALYVVAQSDEPSLRTGCVFRQAKSGLYASRKTAYICNGWVLELTTPHFIPPTRIEDGEVVPDTNTVGEPITRTMQTKDAQGNLKTKTYQYGLFSDTYLSYPKIGEKNDVITCHDADNGRTVKLVYVSLEDEY